MLSVVNELLAVPVVSHQQPCLRLRLSNLSDGCTFLSQWGGDAGISWDQPADEVMRCSAILLQFLLQPFLEADG